MGARTWRLCMTALLLFVASMASAHDFSSGGIYYNILSSSDRTCEVTSNDGRAGSYSGSISIPETVTYSGKTYTVKGIGDYAFNVCQKLTQVIIPNSVTEIGSSAFMSCTGLTEVTIGNSVTTIGGYAFTYCI